MRQLILLLTLMMGLAQAEVARDSLTIDLGGFETTAELTTPTDSEGPFPTVILIHGSGPSDLDNTIASFDPATGEVTELSSNFADIAEFLSENGFAVLRYNKRFVRGPGDIDFERYFTEVDLPQLRDDARTVLEAALEHPLVDAEQLYLYGWSEGSTVAAAVAASEPELAGLILQTPVVRPWRETFTFQIDEVGILYLLEFADEGRVTDETLQQALEGEGGLVAKSIVNYLADPSGFETGQIAINPFLDQDGDGVLDIDTEIVPDGIETVLDAGFSEQGFFSIYSPERALPVLSEQVEALGLPVLILQGALDANTPQAGARELEAALEETGADVTLHVYQGLGHSLGQAESLITDNFAPIVEEPLSDLLAWLNARVD